MRRLRIVLAATVAAVTLAGMAPASAMTTAKATRKGYCKYVRKHQLEFVRIFGIETSVDVAAEISDKEVKGYLKVAPPAIRGAWKTFRQLVRAIASHDSDAISAIAPAAADASQKIIDYTQDKCGSSLPPVPTSKG